MELLDGLEGYTSTNLKDQAELTRLIKSTVASKQFGLEDYLAGLIAQASIYAMPAGNIGGFSTENIRV